ncbi:hypothetical protein PGB90_005442 [Kerria lacca]
MLSISMLLGRETRLNDGYQFVMLIFGPLFPVPPPFSWEFQLASLVLRQSSADFLFFARRKIPFENDQPAA